MAILATQKVLTLDYWKRAAQLKVGDYVFNKNGKIVKIKVVQEYHQVPCFEVTFNDWLTMSGDGNLAFPTQSKKYRDRLFKAKTGKRFRRPLEYKKISNLLELGIKDKRGRLAWSVPTADPLHLPTQPLAIPPFVFGFWFFNLRRDGNMTFRHETVVQEFKDAGYKVWLGSPERTNGQVMQVTPNITKQLIPFLPHKIPENYLMGSYEQRLQLLRGILYAKRGRYNETTDSFQFSTNYEIIFRQVQQLIESLGIKTSVVKSKNWAIFFKSKLPLVHNQVSPPLKVHQDRRFIKSIKPLPNQSCIYIETDGEDNSILVGEGFIPCL